MTHSSRPCRILIVAPAWVGDMVMAHSLFQLLARRTPTPILDILAPPWTHSLASRMPEIHTAHLSPFPRGPLFLRTRYQFAQGLRTSCYDQAIVLPNSFKSALIPYWAHIPKRTGWLGEWPRWLLLNDIRTNPTQWPQMTERFAALSFDDPAPKYIKPPPPTLKTSPALVASALERHHLAKTNRPILALAPGAEFGPSKRWPASHFAELAQRALKEGFDVWLFGSPKDEPIAQHIIAASSGPIQNLVGKTSLTDAVDLLSLATCMVTNDSGLMHIAAALGRPLIALYGSTSPEFTPPLSDQASIVRLNLPCSPCFERTCRFGHMNCLTQIKPDHIFGILRDKISHEPAVN